MFFVCRFSCFVLVSISLCNQSYIHRQGLMFINVSGFLTVVDVCVCTCAIQLWFLFVSYVLFRFVCSWCVLNHLLFNHIFG